MGRPFRVYCLSLVERLGFKTLNRLYQEMDNNEIMEWWAFDKTQNEEWNTKYKKEMHLEAQKNQTLEEEARQIELMFLALGNR